MTVPPLPEETPQPSVTQTNQQGHNINASGQGHTIAGRDIHNYYGPIEQLPRYAPMQDAPVPKPAYIPLSPAKPNAHIEQDARNRVQLMDNVYYTWIEGVLLKNLKMGEFEIGKDLKPGAVLTDAAENTYRLTVDDLDSIEVIFEKMNHQLLILGKPGSGKTIHLLNLAHHLLAQAQQDETKPVPVVLNLSSWIPEKPFERWLVDELKRLYGVSNKVIERWLAHRKLALLLDGLDEIGRKRTEDKQDNQQLREACIEAINRYCHPDNQPGKDPFPIQMCVCSRQEDYLVLRRRITIHNAIVLHDLTEAAVRIYLEGDQWVGVRDLIDWEPSAHEMAKIPFLLNTMKTAYANIQYEVGVPSQGPQLKLPDPTEKKRRNHLLETYVRLQIKHSKPSLYIPHKTLHYLQWLAYQMVRRKTSVFYIEDLDPSMLEQKYNFKRISKLVLGPFWGLILGLIFAWRIRPIFGLIIGPIITLFGTLLGWAIWRILHNFGEIVLAERIYFSLSSKNIIYILLIMLGFGINGYVFGEVVSQVRHGAMFGAILASVFGAVPFVLHTSEDILRRQKPGSGLKNSLVNVIFLWLVVGPISGLTSTLLSSGIGLVMGALVGIVVGAIFDDKLIGLLLGGVVGTLVGMFVGVVVGVVVGLMISNGMNVIRYFVLRYLLAREGSIPSIHHFRITGGYDFFLDHAADLGLLRKVGGGYIFRHRMLMDYLAEQYEKEYGTTAKLAP